jgi:hypothetical protein
MIPNYLGFYRLLPHTVDKSFDLREERSLRTAPIPGISPIWSAAVRWLTDQAVISKPIRLTAFLIPAEFRNREPTLQRASVCTPLAVSGPYDSRDLHLPPPMKACRLGRQ